MGRTRVYGFAVVCAAFGWAGCSIEDTGDGMGAAGANGADAGESPGGSGGKANAPGGRGGSAGSSAGGKRTTPTGGAGDEPSSTSGGAGGEGTSPLPSGGGGGAESATAGAGSGALGGEAMDGGAAGAQAVSNAPGPLTVTVLTRDDQPIAGTLVAFYDPNLQDATVVRADFDGKVTHDVMPGSAVTVGISLTGNPTTTRQLTTFIGTKPGDDLIVRDQSYPYVPLAGHYYVSYTPLAGGDWYYTHVACKMYAGGYANQAPNPINIWVIPDCLDDDDQLTFFSAAYNSQGDMIGVIPTQSVPFTDGGQLALGAWETPEALEVKTIIPAPANGGFVSGSYRNGVRSFFSNTWYIYGNTPQAFSFKVPATGIDSMVIGVEEKFDPDSGFTPLVGRQTVEAPIGEIDRPPTNFLPRLSKPSATTTADGLPEVNWETEASLDQVDGGIIGTHVKVVTLDENNAVLYEDITWTIIVPPGTVGPVSPPPLVGEFEAFAGDFHEPFELTGISFIKSSFIPSYDAFRHDVGRRVIGPREYPIGPEGDFVTERTWLEPVP